VEESISFLIAQVCKAHRNLANALLRERLELHAGQEMFLNFLAKNEGISQSELAQTLCVEAPTLTRTVQRMGQAGMVERRNDPEDARVTRLYLTPQGQETQRRVEAVWRELEEQTIGQMAPDEVEVFRRLLNRVRGNLGA
jgi:DNA-binding MarR family transcriptional regulator